MRRTKIIINDRIITSNQLLSINYIERKKIFASFRKKEDKRKFEGFLYSVVSDNKNLIMKQILEILENQNKIIDSPKELTRDYCLNIESIAYWNRKFDLDLGWPMCFACRDVFVSREKKDTIDNYIKNGGLFQKGWDGYHHCHLINASSNGPGAVWNIVLLCSWCHEVMDNLFSGFTIDYDNMVNWIENRHSIIIKELHKFFKNNEKSVDALHIKYNGGLSRGVSSNNLENFNRLSDDMIKVMNSQECLDFCNKSIIDPNPLDFLKLKIEYTYKILLQ